MSDDLGLAGGGALVDGGTQGIGEAVVARLLEAAVTVLITARCRPGAFELPCPCETGVVHIWILVRDAFAGMTNKLLIFGD